jgi:hypothetical protein
MRRSPNRIIDFFNSRLMLDIAIIIFLAVVVVVSTKIVTVLVDIVHTTTLPFDRDEAQHAIDGWEVYHAFKTHDLRSIANAIINQAAYPPVNSLFVALWYAIGEPGLFYSRLPSVVNLAIMLVFLAWAVYRVVWCEGVQAGQPDRLLPLAGSLAAVSLAVTAGALVTNAALCMFELTGALIAVLFFIYVEAGEVKQKNLWLVGAAVFAWLLFLEKYSFGLFYAFGLGVALLTEHINLSKLSWRDLRKPGLFLAVFILLSFIWIDRTNTQGLLRYISIQHGITDVSETQKFLLNPVSWLGDLSISIPVGIILAILFVLGVVSSWEKLSVRMAFWAIVIAVVLVTALSYTDSRHILFVAPMVWLLAGVGFVRVLQWLKSKEFGAGYSVLLLVLFSVAVFTNVKTFANGLSETIANLYETKPQHRQIQEFILLQVDLERPVLITGELKDTNSLLNLRWLAGIHTNRSLWDITIDQYPFSARERLLRMTSRKLQVSEDTPFTLQSSLSEVVGSDYYAYLVDIINLLDIEYKPANQRCPGLDEKVVQEKTIANYLVIVYDLREK